jgi:putative sterol carrier protein
VADLTNLPHDITPNAFFELVREAIAGQTAPDGPETTIFHLEGADGGSWTASTVDSAIQINSGASGTPILQVTLSVHDWRAIVAGPVRDRLQSATDNAPALDPSAISKLLARPEAIESLRGMEGNLQLVLEDGDVNYRVTLTFGASERDMENPTTTVSVSMDDAAQIASGDDNPQAAFFAGKIRLDGDMNLAMGLMTLAMAG